MVGLPIFDSTAWSCLFSEVLLRSSACGFQPLDSLSKLLVSTEKIAACGESLRRSDVPSCELDESFCLFVHVSVLGSGVR
jgi:hypothetical protein